MLWHLCFPNDDFDTTTQLQDIFDTALATRRRQLTQLMQQNFSVNADSCPDWYGRLLTMPWLRIYTLNVDNLVQQVLSTQRTSRRVRTISAVGATDPIFDNSAISVIHLNGQLDDVPEDVTFTRSQYALRTDRERAYTQLRNDLFFRSVVFIGSSMEEGPLWQHLEMRGPPTQRGEKEIRPRSYLIVPTLNRSKQALLSRHNVAWLPMSTLQFCKSILDDMVEESRAGHQILSQLADSNTDSPEKFSHVADLAAGDTATEEYLLGAEPTWSDVVGNRVANLGCFDELWDQICDMRSRSSGRHFLIVTGTAGTGKSSAMMVTAMRLEADGVPVAWIDSNSFYARHGFRTALGRESNLGALFINDADIYDRGLSSMVMDAITANPRLLVVCEMRSAKIDRTVVRHELADIRPLEFTMSGLADGDIDAILDVLDREHRLGRLKGVNRDERRRIFQAQAGRQLLVAMHYATHGRDFGEKAKDELKQMSPDQQVLYGLICVASAYRFALRQDDVGIACADQDSSWLQTLDSLVRRKLILPYRKGMYRARHRMIGQFVLESLREEGRLHYIVAKLVKIGATKTTQFTDRQAVHARLLRTFLNHNFMQEIDLMHARQIYSDFEDALSWNYHYWLHRGALELETDNLDLAENFLHQAKAIYPGGVFIDNELAYLSFKKANRHPGNSDSAELVQGAIDTLNDIVSRYPDQLGHAYHIMGQQGLVWANHAILDKDKKKEFLHYLKDKAKIAADYTRSDMLRTLHKSIQHAILMLAVDD